MHARVTLFGDQRLRLREISLEQRGRRARRDAEPFVGWLAELDH